jgi:hypothetical protein|tara:strand:+ start:44 stop:400 length:357 start_codon:yes stop_codon:yes gene_type:complete
MKTYSFFTDEFLDLKLTKKEIKQRKDQSRAQGDIGFPEVDYYYEYKRLGGSENRKKFFKILDVFLEETYDIFINGDYTNRPQYKSREDSFDGVADITNLTYDDVFLIYESVNNVTAYT